MPSALFDLQKQISKTNRASARLSRMGISDGGFLHREAASIMGERLAATKRVFITPVLLFDGLFADDIEASILAHSPPVKGKIKRLAFPADETETLDIQPESIDLALCVFDLHRMIDLPQMLFQINQALKPDGLFLGVLPSEGTLQELRESVMRAEIETSGGAGNRIDSFAHVRQLGDLLQKTGFKLPVADVEERIVRYKTIDKLIEDLRNTGAGYASAGVIRPISSRTLEKAKEHYASNYSDNDKKLRATFNMACLSGWKEDPSQQKPLRPGSAKNQLRDFL
ncbi:MAG: SAM-dependent methyltransferase [Salaquimonas sp.]